MVVVDKNKLKDFLKAEILYQLHKNHEEMKIFSKKYGKSFKDFEKEINSLKEENFEKWDDYLEWKAIVKEYENLKKQLEDIEIGNIKVS